MVRNVNIFTYAMNGSISLREYLILQRTGSEALPKPRFKDVLHVLPSASHAQVSGNDGCSFDHQIRNVP